MKGLKFDFERSAEAGGLPMYMALRGDLSDPGETLLKLRALQSFDRGAARYAIHRTVRCAVRRPLDEVFDDLALHAEFVAQRMDSTSLLLDGPGVFISVEGSRKIDYGSRTFHIWAESMNRLDQARAKMLIIVVLIFRGPTGTGKTRLVRAILAAMSARKADSAQVPYTADMRALENDEIFVDFIAGNHDAFVIEDADHLLMARSNGNVDLHRFLAVADGVVRAQGRKIIFTTNLPNIGDIDDALVRPGRCFATVRTRALERREAALLLARIAAVRAKQSEPASAVGLAADVGSITLAALYRMVDTEG